MEFCYNSSDIRPCELFYLFEAVLMGRDKQKEAPERQSLPLSRKALSFIIFLVVILGLVLRYDFRLLMELINW